ncbi:hypothetical protein SBI_06041 [Streptomyces bingchenggensis BCW-1]|uniref:Uncharacterized protein n=1 Tax=Streptomyces bingchenggensis (strain BCW-1) TaxID=749414 RepID=D7CHW1_STRBB|nr:hypothetical protein SBI_06041 [Streptomyces bingchenggensis BCW-1]
MGLRYADGRYDAVPRASADSAADSSGPAAAGAPCAAAAR